MNHMNETPEAIKRLVDQFGRNLDTCKSPAYNETQLRIEFVNPFWKALGWDDLKTELQKSNRYVFNPAAHSGCTGNIMHRG